MRTEDFINAIQRAMKPVKDRLMTMIARSVIASIDDSQPIQQAQVKVLFGESLDKVQRFQQYGFNSVPPANTEAIILFLGGNRENAVLVATDNRNLRPTGWAPGESGFYNHEGSFAVLREGGKLEVDNGTEELIEVLVDLVDAILESKNITAIGPQPMTPESIQAITDVKTRLETFKV